MWTNFNCGTNGHKSIRQPPTHTLNMCRNVLDINLSIHLWWAVMHGRARVCLCVCHCAWCLADFVDLRMHLRQIISIVCIPSLHAKIREIDEQNSHRRTNETDVGKFDIKRTHWNKCVTNGSARIVRCVCVQDVGRSSTIPRVCKKSKTLPLRHADTDTGTKCRFMPAAYTFNTFTDYMITVLIRSISTPLFVFYFLPCTWMQYPNWTWTHMSVQQML